VSARVVVIVNSEPSSIVPEVVLNRHDLCGILLRMAVARAERCRTLDGCCVWRAPSRSPGWGGSGRPRPPLVNGVAL